MTVSAELLVPALVAGLCYLAIVALTIIVLALRAGARRDDSTDQQGMRAVSRFTIPVSVIVPLPRGANVDATLKALAGLQYPELEIIAVVSQSAGAEFDQLAASWQFEAKEFFYRQLIATADVRRLYRSNRDARVMLVEKAAGSRADAVNCGLNIARYRYVTVIDPGITFAPDALLRLMAAPLRDPGTVLVATAHVERLGLFDRLAAARSMMDSRLFWRYRSRAFGTAGLIYAWRRDALLEAKGFSSSAFDPESDMIRRAVVAASTQGAPARIYRSVDIFGTTGPRPLRSVLADAGRRQLNAIAQLALLSPAGLAAFGVKAVAWQLAASLLTPLVELLVIAVTAVAAVSGVLSPAAALATVALLSLGRASVTTAALLMRGVAPGAPDERLLMRLVAVGPLELLGFRPLLAAASLFASRH